MILDPFLFLLLLTVLCCFFPARFQRVLSLFIVLYMLFICGFRNWNVGTDTYAYISFFEDELNQLERIEPFFKLLIVLTSYVTDNYQLFLFIVASITYIPLFVVLNKVSNSPCLSLLLFETSTMLYFFETFNILRQSISIVFLLYFYYYLENNKIYKSFFYYIIAVMFHYTSIVAIVFMLFKITNVFKYGISFIAVCSIFIISILIGSNVDVINVLINILYPFYKMNIGGVCESYISYILYNETVDYMLYFSRYIPLVVIAIVVYTKEISKTVYYKSYFIGVVLLCLFGSVEYVVRFLSGITILQLFIVPIFFQEQLLYKKILMCMYVAITIFVYVRYLVYQTPYSGVLPYSFCF